MNKNVLILDGNNEEGTLNINSSATEMQLNIRGVGLETEKKVYLNFESEGMDFGQTVSVSDISDWRTIHFPKIVSGPLKISRPNYNMTPETADGVSVIISNIRWR